jgi:DNA-binding MarR family transcriptional regulator
MANNTSPETCAAAILDVVPGLMQLIRAEMRARRSDGLSLAQFRALALLSRSPGASLSTLTDHLALSPAGAFAVVDSLVERGLVSRREDRGDRRRIALAATAAGRRILDQARQAARQSLAAKLAGLDVEGRRRIAEAMSDLRQAFLA